MIDLKSLCSGIVGAILGALITYWSQHRLVTRQIAAAERTQAEYLSLLKDARGYFGERSKQIASSLANIEHYLSKLNVG
jgi:hypothetical protein